MLQKQREGTVSQMPGAKVTYGIWNHRDPGREELETLGYQLLPGTLSTAEKDKENSLDSSFLQFLTVPPIALTQLEASGPSGVGLEPALVCPLPSRRERRKMRG